MPKLVVRPEPLDSPAATQLLRELDEDLDERYGGGEPVTAEPAEFAPPGGLFLIAYVDGQPQACAGYRRYDARTAELKRMYVRTTGRHRGLAKHLLRALEHAAAADGYEQMWLETGVPQYEAITLYTSAGYEPVEPFGQFSGAPQQRCFGKRLH